MNDVEGARALIESNIADWISNSLGRKVGMKYPVCVDNKEDLLAWLRLQPMGTFYSLTHKGLIDESYIPELVEVFQDSFAIRQTSVDITDCFTNEELINGGIQRIFRNIINLRSHCLYFPLIYNENNLIDNDWKLVMKLILRYNNHLVTNGDPEFFRRVEPFETLYSYCYAAIKQYHIKEPLLTKESIQYIFNFVRENNYDLLYKNECQNWRNKINRVKNTAGFPADRLEKTQAAFADFKKEALQRKKAVKTGTASPKEFTDWLYQQSDIILKLTTF